MDARRVLLMGVLLPFVARSGNNEVVHASPTALRSHAVAIVLPEYPVATGRKQGLVVALATVAPDGQVKAVEVLQSFDDAASVAVKVAVRRSRFSDIRRSSLPNVVRVGKLLFQFTYVGGKPLVVELKLAPKTAGTTQKEQDKRQ